MLKKFEIYSIKKIRFGQKRPCVLRDIVPIGVFLQSRGGRVLNNVMAHYLQKIARSVSRHPIMRPTES